MSDKMSLCIKEIVQETADSKTINFAQPDPHFEYVSGQFITLIAEIEGKEERRSYSLSSSPYHEEHLAVTIKRVKNGRMSNYLIDNLKVGDKVMATSPAGNFKFEPENTPDHIVLVGAGSGITPLFSIIKTALLKAPGTSVSLIYINPSRENTIFYQDLEQWASKFPSRFRIVYYWSDAVKSEQSEAGFLRRFFRRSNTHRINPARLKTIFRSLQIRTNLITRFYICGPQKLMDMASATIKKLGVSEDLIHKESFYCATKAKKWLNHAQQVYQVKLILNGKEHEVNVPGGEPVLFPALSSGIDIPYSCQSGHCNSCVGRRLSGKIEMSASEGLTEEQVKAGYVLTCVGYPQSDDVVVEFS